MNDCTITDIQRIDFAEGVDDSIDDHVMTCDDCQLFLAELWHGQLVTDLSEPVLRVLSLEDFLIAVIREGGGILARIGQALRVYGLGGEIP